MEYIFQFGIVAAVTFCGELLHAVIPLPVPAGIYGLLLMFLCLQFRIIPIEKVEKAGDFLIKIMPIMFLPINVGIIAVWGELKPVLLPVITITLSSTVLVVLATGRTSQAVIRRREGRHE